MAIQSWRARSIKIELNSGSSVSTVLVHENSNSDDVDNDNDVASTLSPAAILIFTLSSFCVNREGIVIAKISSRVTNDIIYTTLDYNLLIIIFRNVRKKVLKMCKSEICRNFSSPKVSAFNIENYV